MSNKKINSYFKKQNSQDSASSPNLETSINLDNAASKYQDYISELSPTKVQKIDQSSNCPYIERDPKLRKSIWDYPMDKRYEIRCDYLISGPYQGIPEKSPKYVDGKRFLHSWLKLFSDCLNSLHKIAVKYYHDLINTLQHIEKVIDKQSMELVAKNRWRFKVSIDVTRLCAVQGITFRAHNECLDSHNHGNFLEIMKHTTSYNDEVRSIILENASYTSSQIQKEILSLYASRIQIFIKKEIGDANYCLIMNESRNESKREQMAFVLRFVNKEGFILERLFDVVYVDDTKTSTLKREISSYDGASTMREDWNDLQALFLNEFPYAYYHFFLHLAITVNLVDSSYKRHDQLHIANAIRIAELISTNELETGKGKNQIGTAQCLGDTRWSSHLRSLLSLLDMFDHILLVLSEIINDKSSLFTKASTDGAYDIMTSFEFVFILHFMIELLQMTDDFFVNTKELLQKFRENGWDQLFDKVKSFCKKHKIDVPYMNAPRRSGRDRLHKGNPIILEHHYQIDIFTGTIDSILQEMSYRFDENRVKLLRLNSTLDTRDGYKSFNINNICKLLKLFEFDIRRNIHFQNMSTLSELCQVLSKTWETMNFYLVDRLIKLILTLPVSTATTERAFSSMKFVKTRLRNKMKYDFLASSLLMYNKKEIAQTFNIDSIIDEFNVMIKKRRTQFRMFKLNK
ncbi:hypothetical protein Pfo_019150 [Paulownia fortunei]|nr:hypothetical protein Pfo_019150 [Paulownia fortunei]